MSNIKLLSFGDCKSHKSRTHIDFILSVHDTKQAHILQFMVLGIVAVLQAVLPPLVSSNHIHICSYYTYSYRPLYSYTI